MSRVDEVKAEMNEILDNAEREINEIVRSFRITVEDFRRDPSPSHEYMYNSQRSVYNERGEYSVKGRIDRVVNDALAEIRSKFPNRDNRDLAQAFFLRSGIMNSLPVETNEEIYRNINANQIANLELRPQRALMREDRFKYKRYEDLGNNGGFGN